MRPDTLSVKDIFERERRYVVPLYQRSYVWQKDEQWDPLWEDIARQAAYCLAEPDGIAKRSHFLGAVVLNVSKIVGRSLPRSEIIDGQQRLTTLQLFLAALRDYAVSRNDRTANLLLRLTRNPDTDEYSEELFKVWPTNVDRETFRQVLTASSAEAVRSRFAANGQSALPRMAEAYQFFYQSVSGFVEEGANDKERGDRLYAIVQALRTALQFVVIELEDADDPQVIFETLNARGQALLPSDLIRNYVFMQAASKREIDADRLYDTYWRAFDEKRDEKPDANGEDRFWHRIERQGRLLRPRIDLFMFHYLVMKKEDDLNIGQLFREFRNWRTGQSDTIPEFLTDLNRYSVHFARLMAPAGTDRLADFARRLRSIDTSTVFPVLLFLMGLPEEQLPRQVLSNIAADLESFLVRRFICGLTTKNYNRLFVALLTKIKRAAAADGDLGAAVRSELLRSSEPTAVWPGDDEFRQAWLSKPVYVRSRIDRSAMVLRAIEERMRTPKNEALAVPETLTVEHLLPQNPDMSDYPYAPELPLEGDETPERCRARLIHTLGNLTLLTSSLNASVSNGPFPHKRAEIAANSDLRINAWLRGEGCPDSDTWSEIDIVARGKDLVGVATLIWPYPQTDANQEPGQRDR